VSRNYNNALVLIRVAGVAYIALGLMGLAYVGVIFVLVVRHAPKWMTGEAASYAATSIIGSPLYILLGGILLVFSGRLARFVAKHTQPEGDSASRSN